MSPRYSIATFTTAPGRYLVWDPQNGWYSAVRILNARQERYGNKPDPETGLYLDESRVSMYGGNGNLKSLKPLKLPTRIAQPGA